MRFSHLTCFEIRDWLQIDNSIHTRTDSISAVVMGHVSSKCVIQGCVWCVLWNKTTNTLFQ